jgi:PKD repeat protein
MDEYGNTYAASHNGGQIVRYDSTFVSEELISSGHVEPAGLDYNSTYKILAIPNFGGHTIDYISPFLDLTAEATSGWAPFEVNFSGSIRDFQADSWIWDFGDGGSGSGNEPIHTYTEPGIYDVSLSVVTGDDTISYTKRDYIITLADTISAVGYLGEPGGSVEVEILARNTVPLSKIRIPVEYSGPFGLTLDSISAAGCRTENFDNVNEISSDPLNRRATFRVSNDVASETPDMDPGYGPVLKIYFTISPYAPYGYTNPIILDGYSSYTAWFEGPLLNYEPANIAGEVGLIGVCGDADNNSAVNILDITYLISYLYKDGPEPESMWAADPDGNGMVNILDITYLISFLYKDGPDPLCA